MREFFSSSIGDLLENAIGTQQFALAIYALNWVKTNDIIDQDVQSKLDEYLWTMKFESFA